MKVKPFLYFASQRLIGSHVHEYLREFVELERAKAGRLEELRDRRLESLLQHAVTSVPFYRERITTRRPTLQEFPVLTKADIRDRFLDLMTPELKLEYAGKQRKAPYSWIEVKTGGSTGMPTAVIHDREYRDRGRAARLYSQRMCGLPLGTPYLRLWGSMQEVNQARDSLKNRLQSYLSSEVWLKAFHMEEEDMQRHIATINASSVQHLMAYVDAAAELAGFARKKNLAVRPLKSIMACAGTVTDDMRQILQEVFQARVHNMYGSRDCSSMACECEQGRLHVYAHHLILEVVDEAGFPLGPHQSGRLLVTLLSNRSFPMIRYEIGDVGALGCGECHCGRPFPLMDSIEGRTLEFLTSTEGGYVSPLYIVHLIGVVHNPGYVKRFQLVQHSRTDFELKLELEPGSDFQRRSELMDLLDRDLKTVLGREACIRRTEVEEICRSASGKFLYTINAMRSKHESPVLSHPA